jgi:aspartate racemase
MNGKLGILGGMGPLATADFFRKLVERTPATCDREHIPVILSSVPQLPDRMDAIFKGGPTPVRDLVQAIRTLRAAGAICIAMPCNTAHYWYDEIVKTCDVPFLHIVDAAVVAVHEQMSAVRRVALLGTRGTLRAGFYQQRMADVGLAAFTCSEAAQNTWIDPAIAAIKANRLDAAAVLVNRAAETLLQEGADAIVLACTELPLVLTRLDTHLQSKCVDATLALADACVRWWQAHASAATA